MATSTTRTGQEVGWRCPTCGRTFRRMGQRHSCRRVPLEDHLRTDDARSRFEHLLAVVRREVGPCEVLSLPCCIHLVGSYDFLAVLPRRERLEIHLALEREVDDPRILAANRLSATSWMHRVDLRTDADVDDPFLDWVREAYHLRDGEPGGLPDGAGNDVYRGTADRDHALDPAPAPPGRDLVSTRRAPCA